MSRAHVLQRTSGSRLQSDTRGLNKVVAQTWIIFFWMLFMLKIQAVFFLGSSCHQKAKNTLIFMPAVGGRTAKKGRGSFGDIPGVENFAKIQSGAFFGGLSVIE